MDPFSLKVPFLKVETVFYLLNRIIYLGEAFLELASTDEYIHNSIHPKSLVSKSKCIQHDSLSPVPTTFFFWKFLTYTPGLQVNEQPAQEEVRGAGCLRLDSTPVGGCSNR